MNRTAWMCLALFCWLQVSSFAEAQLIVYVVRHGEKLDKSEDPPLSPAGKARALRLAQMLAASGVKAIYTTEYRRTMQLAAPTAIALT